MVVTELPIRDSEKQNLKMANLLPRVKDKARIKLYTPPKKKRKITVKLKC